MAKRSKTSRKKTNYDYQHIRQLCNKHDYFGDAFQNDMVSAEIAWLQLKIFILAAYEKYQIKRRPWAQAFFETKNYRWTALDADTVSKQRLAFPEILRGYQDMKKAGRKPA